MPTPKNIYILMERIEDNIDKLTPRDKRLIYKCKICREEGKRLSDILWEELVELWIRLDKETTKENTND
jgi:hypothetical protein